MMCLVITSNQACALLCYFLVAHLLSCIQGLNIADKNAKISSIVPPLHGEYRTGPPRRSGWCRTSSDDDPIIRHRVKSKLAIILPYDASSMFSYDKVSPGISRALDILDCRFPHVHLEVRYADSKCSPRDAPVAAFDLYMKGLVNVFFGPVCDYSLAPVARYAPYWNIPIISPGGMAHDFGRDKSSVDAEFPSLTRVGATFDSLADNLVTMAQYYRWNSVKILYTAHGREYKGFCFLAVAAIVKHIKTAKMRFDVFLMDSKAQDNVDVILRRELALTHASMSLYVLC